jgi:hypothetical protein
MTLRRAGGIVVAVVLALSLSVVAPAAAKKQNKKPKSPPVTVVSKTQSTTSDNQQLTITASCPAGLLAVGGGFEAPIALAGSPTDVNVVYESRRSGGGAWQVSVVREDSGSPGNAVPVTAYVDCRSAKLAVKKPAKKASAAKKRKKKLRITEVSGSATGAANAGSQVTANASCPTGTRALGGGFSSSPAPNLGSGSVSYPIFWASYRTSSSDWFSGMTEAGSVAATVTSYAYCAKALKISESSGTATLPASGGTTIGSATATTPSCPKRLSQLGGGFNDTPATVGSAIAIQEASKPVGRSWQFSASNLNSISGSLTSHGYCA